jgi:SPP1 gp7 family putative phage head morphogenesis protein
MAYWQDRLQAAQNALAAKRREEIEKRMKEYYVKLSKQVINEYESLYDKVLLQKANGEAISPATLYKMDKYWSLKTQIRKKLNKFGAYQTELLSKVFSVFYQDSYTSLNIDGLTAFKTLDNNAVRQVLESIWTNDGKNWSQRIWDNLALLQESLEEGLVECVAVGKKTSDLKALLQDRFSVSYTRADTLVRTELAHIQTEAAKQRYNDYGIEQVEIWADPDERTCEICGKLHKKKYPVGAHVPIPAHPRCRCCIVPVVNTNKNVIKGLDDN